MKKKDQIAFYKQAHALILACGATELPHRDVIVPDEDPKYHWREFTAETECGPLKLTLDYVEAGNQTRRIVGTVYGKFADVPRAVETLGRAVNQFSGKWNHLYMDEENAVGALETQLEKVGLIPDENY